MKSKLNLITLLCLIIFASIISSGLTFYYLRNNQQITSTTTNKQVTLLETSAIIDLNKKVSQSVVSLVSEVTQ